MTDIVIPNKGTFIGRAMILADIEVLISASECLRLGIFNG